MPDDLDLFGMYTMQQIKEDTGLGETKIREAMKALGIDFEILQGDRRKHFYTREDVQRIRDWVRERGGIA